MRGVTLRDSDGLHVEAALRPDGTLVIEGQDLRGAGEYEYAITVKRDDVGVVRVALGGEADDDLLELLSRQADLIVGRVSSRGSRSSGYRQGSGRGPTDLGCPA